MVLTSDDCKDVECPVHVVKAHLEVATRVVIHGKCAVLVGHLRVVKAEQAFQQHDRPCLELNCLKEISKLELDGSDLDNTCGDVLSHGS